MLVKSRKYAPIIPAVALLYCLAGTGWSEPGENQQPFSFLSPESPSPESPAKQPLPTVDAGWALSPIFAPLTETKGLKYLQHLRYAQELQIQLSKGLAEATDYGEVVQLSPQTEAEFVVIHEDGRIEFSNTPAAPAQPQYKILRNPAPAQQARTENEPLEDLLSEDSRLSLPDAGLVLYMSAPSRESYDATVEQKLADPGTLHSNLSPANVSPEIEPSEHLSTEDQEKTLQNLIQTLETTP